MRKCNIILLFLIFLLGSSFNVFGQQAEGANWLFGDSVSISFLPGPGPNLTNLNLSSSDDGPGSISDKHGKLLFYTNGEDVFTKTGQIMPNGQGISFGPRGSRKKSIIVPKPGSANSYYVITVGGYFSLSEVKPEAWLSEVNMELNGGFGDVVEGKKNILIRENVTIGLSVAAHANGLDKWLILHKRISTNTFLPGSRIYEFYLINNQGISFVKSQLAPVTHGILAADYIFNYVTSPNSKILVGGSEFDDRIHTFILAQDTGGFVQSYFGGLFDYLSKPAMAFSPNSKFLYVADIKRLYQINLDTLPLTLSDIGKLPVTRPYLYGNFQNNHTVYYTDLQLAPNGKIYVIPYRGAKFLASIECPNVRGVGCGFKDSAVWLGGRKTGYSFPVLNQTLFVNAGKLQAQAARDTICQGDSVEILAYGAGAERFTWFRNNETTLLDTGGIIKVAPTVNTVYRVRGTGTCAGVKDTSIQIVVVPRPVISMGADSKACGGKTFTYTYPSQNNYRYLWKSDIGTGNFTTKGYLQLSVFDRDTAWNGKIKLTLSNAGCAVTDSIQVQVNPTPKNKPILSPRPDTTICQGQNAVLSASSLNNLKWHWSTGDSTQSILVSAPGIYTCRYKSLEGCLSDSFSTVLVNVNPLPTTQTLSNLKKDSTLCFPAQIQLGIAPEPNISYTWQGQTDSLSNSQISNPSFTFQNQDTLVKTLDYKLVTLNAETGCKNSDSITLKVVPFLKPNTGPDKSFCAENQQMLGLPGVSNFAYQWSPAVGLQTPQSAQTLTNIESPSFENVLKQSFIRTVSLLGCQANDTVEVQVFPKVPKPQLAGPQFVCPGVQNVPYSFTTNPILNNYQLSIFNCQLTGGDSIARIRINWHEENPNGGIQLKLGNIYGCQPDSVFLPVNITRNLRPQTQIVPGLNDSLCLASAQNIGYQILPFNLQSRYRWRIEPAAVLADSIHNPLSITYNQPGIYILNLAESDTTPIAQCFGETAYKVRIWPQPIAKAILGKDSLCHFSSEPFTVDNEQLSSQYNWTSSKGAIENANPNGGKATFLADFDLQTDFTSIELKCLETSEKGCRGPENSKVVVVEALPAPKIVVPNENLEWKSLENRTYEAIGRQGSTFNWEAGNGTITSGQGTSQVGIHWLPDQLRYLLKVQEISRIGCIGESDFQTIPYDSALFIANLITPNGDGKNDRLEIKNLHFYPDNQLEIYNRWGMKVFSAMPYRQDWPREHLSSGLYFFNFSAMGRVIKGWVMVAE